MRTILFKAKKLSDGKWAKGSLVKTPFGTFIEWYEDSVCNKEEVDPSTVCQFTGLKDEDGKEIWEHDILKNYPMENEVVFKNGSFMIIEDYGDEINEVPLSETIYEDGICILEKIDSKFDRKEGEK